MSMRASVSSLPDSSSPSDRLATLISRLAPTDGAHETAIRSLTLFRQSTTSLPNCGVLAPALAVVAQGSKRVMLGGESYLYDRAHFLVTSVDLPVLSQVTRATAAMPYLGLLIRLDTALIGRLMADTALPPGPLAPVARGLSVSRLTPLLADAVFRLVQLLEAPNDVAILSASIEREITYRLLQSDQGYRLRQRLMAGGQAQQVAKAVDWLKEHFADPLRIDKLARTVRMSPSSLHQHFKTVTTMSPLQYQKRLRLEEARRLMLSQSMDAASASHHVGYQSPSQFSREYRRVFGEPPRRDVEQLLRGDIQAG
jgi:AraC-like DNA-binding protein